MTRVFLILAAMAMTIVSACTTGNDGSASGSGVYRIRNEEKVQFRMLDSINALRQAMRQPGCGFERAVERGCSHPFSGHVGAKPPLALRLGRLVAA